MGNNDVRFSCKRELDLYFLILFTSSTFITHNMVINNGESLAVVSFLIKNLFNLLLTFTMASLFLRDDRRTNLAGYKDRWRGKRDGWEAKKG